MSEQHTSTSDHHGLWPEIAALADSIAATQVVETAAGPISVHDLGTVAEAERTIAVHLTFSEARALDDLIQVGASVMLRARGQFPARDLSGAQRKLQSAVLHAS